MGSGVSQNRNGGTRFFGRGLQQHQIENKKDNSDSVNLNGRNIRNVQEPSRPIILGPGINQGEMPEPTAPNLTPRLHVTTGISSSPRPAQRSHENSQSPVVSTGSSPSGRGNRAVGDSGLLFYADNDAVEHAENEAEVFAHTAMSLGMDQEDLLFNILYFGGADTTNMNVAIGNARDETMALHSENNTPYKLRPAAASVLGKLKPEPLKSIEELEDRDCAVCKDEMEIGTQVVHLPTCSHCFHEDCLIRWLKLQGFCPVCRAPLTEEVLNQEPSIDKPGTSVELQKLLNEAARVTGLKSDTKNSGVQGVEIRVKEETVFETDDHDLDEYLVVHDNDGDEMEMDRIANNSNHDNRLPANNKAIPIAGGGGVGGYTVIVNTRPVSADGSEIGTHVKSFSKSEGNGSFGPSTLTDKVNVNNAVLVTRKDLDADKNKGVELSPDNSAKDTVHATQCESKADGDKWVQRDDSKGVQSDGACSSSSRESGRSDKEREMNRNESKDGSSTGGDSGKEGDNNSNSNNNSKKSNKSDDSSMLSADMKGSHRHSNTTTMTQNDAKMFRAEGKSDSDSDMNINRNIRKCPSAMSSGKSSGSVQSSGSDGFKPDSGSVSGSVPGSVSRSESVSAPPLRASSEDSKATPSTTSQSEHVQSAMSMSQQVAKSQSESQSQSRSVSECESISRSASASASACKSDTASGLNSRSRSPYSYSASSSSAGIRSQEKASPYDDDDNEERSGNKPEERKDQDEDQDKDEESYRRDEEKEGPFDGKNRISNSNSNSSTVESEDEKGQSNCLVNEVSAISGINNDGFDLDLKASKKTAEDVSEFSSAHSEVSTKCSDFK